MEEAEETINFWVNGVCTSIVVVCGIFLNCFAIHIIRKRYDGTNIFYQMLLRLLCFDICVLLTWMNLSLFTAFRLNNRIIIELVPYFSYPATHIAISASTFMTLAIAHERYLAVKYPLKYSEDMKTPKILARRLRIYMIMVLLISITFNLPYFFELEVSYIKFSNKTANGSLVHSGMCLEVNGTSKNNSCNQLHSEIRAKLGYTFLAKHPYYLKYYKNISRLILGGIIPFALLIYFNTMIYKAIKKSIRLRRRLTLSEPPSRLISVQSGVGDAIGSFKRRHSELHTSRRRSRLISERSMGGDSIGSFKRANSGLLVTSKRREEVNLSMVFVVMVIVFIVCNTLKFGLNFYDGVNGTVGASSISRIIAYFSNLLVILNSSINMIIYCVMNAKFRRHLSTAIKSLLPCIKTTNPRLKFRPSRRVTLTSQYNF